MHINIKKYNINVRPCRVSITLQTFQKQKKYMKVAFDFKIIDITFTNGFNFYF